MKTALSAATMFLAILVSTSSVFAADLAAQFDKIKNEEHRPFPPCKDSKPIEALSSGSKLRDKIAKNLSLAFDNREITAIQFGHNDQFDVELECSTAGYMNKGRMNANMTFTVEGDGKKAICRGYYYFYFEPFRHSLLTETDQGFRVDTCFDLASHKSISNIGKTNLFKSANIPSIASSNEGAWKIIPTRAGYGRRVILEKIEQPDPPPAAAPAQAKAPR
jgi:hypothetical protein